MVLLILCLSCEKKIIVDNKSVEDSIIENWELVWCDDFDQNNIDDQKWNKLRWRPGWVNNEEQAYTNRDTNIFTRDGKLVIRASRLGLGPTDFLFFNQSSTQHQNAVSKPLSVQSFDKELRRVCEWNGLKGISSHSFRRTQLTELYKDGWSLREIQHISGHKSLQSLQEYLDVDKEEVVHKFRQRMVAL